MILRKPGITPGLRSPPVSGPTSLQVYRVQQAIVFELRSNNFSHLQKLCLCFHSQFHLGFLYDRVCCCRARALPANDTHSTIQEVPGAQMPSAFVHRLEFRNVCFAYTDCQVVLRDVSLTIPAGKTIALVGRSGSGSVSSRAARMPNCWQRGDYSTACT
jgi:ABC-type transport system involved in cytochrome bd biosynthesis fused ATPase/permease subunit